MATPETHRKPDHTYCVTIICTDCGIWYTATTAMALRLAEDHQLIHPDAEIHVWEPFP